MRTTTDNRTAGGTASERLERLERRVDDVAHSVAGRFARGNVCSQMRPALTEQQLEAERAERRRQLQSAG